MQVTKSNFVKKQHMILHNKTAEQSSEYLAELLANEYMLYLQTLNCHWNITGKNFIAIHQLLEQQYEWLKETIDQTAERIRTLGYVAPAHYKKYAQAAHLDEGNEQSAFEEMILHLANSHQEIVTLLRKYIAATDKTDDFATCDMLTKFLGEHEKQLWMLRSHTYYK
jgi:starvation-inducible DNA-binding protein